MKIYYIKSILLFIILCIALSFFKVDASFPLSGKTIILDIGHGGRDPGTIAGNIHESDINLNIAKYLEYYLSINGASVILVRDDDYDLSSPKISNRKRSDFNNRIKLINESDADMYLSIHLNYLEDGSYYGPQVFYNAKNKELATAIQTHLNEKLGTKRKIKKIPNSTYMYSKLKKAGVLIECGFLSNYNERMKLTTDKYQQKIAQYITEAIINYY